MSETRDRAKYLGMRSGDLDGKAYAKYWNPEMGPMQEHAQRALIHGAEAQELGFEVEEADQLLEPGYLPMETGFTRLESGQVFVAVLTKMPGVTAEMIDWWFGWHYMEDQRYKLWHPRAHLSQEADRMIGDDPDKSDREKYLHNPNFVTEYVGAEALDLVISLTEPSEFLDVDRFEEARVGTAICGTVGYRDKGVNFALLIHQIRETGDGSEMRSRFWMGNFEIRRLRKDGLVNKIVGTKFVAKHAIPLELGRDMFVHCAMEMNHLAGFLPELYADQH
ncbi:MAG: hypothetical protein IH940_10595 [Acidobacteria bacterium]|nr:hypothetical protein [Acidobacteriota bacterium]